jgi:hypothetical protein
MSIPGVMMLDPADVPTIQITNIAGMAVSQPPTGSPVTPDVIIPASTGNPIDIDITATNIPDGAVIPLRIVLSTGEILEVDSSPVSSNAATASTTLLTAIGVIYATANFTP